MNKIYESPLRVYLALGALALWGLLSGFNLPISLFPNSSKPIVAVEMSYGDMSATEFLNTYGRRFEDSLQSISMEGTEVDSLKAKYSPGSVRYKIEFKWGADPRKALREVQNVTSAFIAPLPQEIRDATQVYTWSDSTGFIAISFYSQKRTLDELYKFLEPQLLSPVQRVHDATGVELWNPLQKEVKVDLNPEKMAMLGIYPRDVGSALLAELTASRGGSVVEGLNQLKIEMPPIIRSVEDLKRATIPTRTGSAVHLGDIAHVDLGPSTSSSQIIKTSGIPSVILWAAPRPGGNVKKMAEDIIDIVHQLQKNWPADIEAKVLVDPSEFIRSAVTNVVHEVIVAALLAVLVLFLFIGNIRNVVTAAIEIPLSIVLAFILMRLMGINLNLISLGGLALSAGMNVDGSVVVMENIFRHFELAKGPLTAKDRLRILTQAVSEVRFPIIASTIASLVVFIPLAFTSQLTNAILGDLAMAVVFSHGFSAIVALILVPTVRLQLMARSNEKPSHSFLEPYFRKMEETYAKWLGLFLKNRKLKKSVYFGLATTLLLLLVFVLPQLPREIVGKPDTDWIILNASTKGNSLIRQMDSISDMVEGRMLQKFGARIRYTFTMVQTPNETMIMARLVDKHEMQKLWKAFEAEFVNTPELEYSVRPWNPSELKVPDPPNLSLSIRGTDTEDRIQAAREIYTLMMDHHVFPRLTSDPDLATVDSADLIAAPEQWTRLASAKSHLTPTDLSDVSRVATLGRKLWQMPLDGVMVPIQLGYPPLRVNSLTDLESLPVGVNGKLVPLKALISVHRHLSLPDPYRENTNDRVMISGRINKGEEKQIPEALKTTRDLLNKWLADTHGKHTAVATIEDADHELNEALNQLEFAVGLSILLIFVTMVFQFGDVVNSVLVLVSVPLGIIGVLLSLFICQSTLSLNSALGMILLNGIAVANSIILVDFLKRLVEQGQAPAPAAVHAAQTRLRPILMTSLTTGLGMLPIALGFGEGGRILQPLGIAVVGGLAFSMLTTLFIVPSLQVSYLEWKQRRHTEKVGKLGPSAELDL